MGKENYTDFVVRHAVEYIERNEGFTGSFAKGLREYQEENINKYVEENLQALVQPEFNMLLMEIVGNLKEDGNETVEYFTNAVLEIERDDNKVEVSILDKQ